MSDEKTTGKTFSGCCGPNVRFPKGMPEEMSRMMEKFCGEDGSFDCTAMMEKFRGEDGTFDCGQMMKKMQEMFAPPRDEKEPD